MLPNTLPPEFVDDLQNHFLAGILAPMRDVALLFFLHKTKTPKTVGGRDASPARLSRSRCYCPILEHEAGFNRAASLVGVAAADSECEFRGARDEVGKVNDRDVSSKEEGILHPGRGHGE